MDANEYFLDRAIKTTGKDSIVVFTGGGKAVAVIATQEELDSIEKLPKAERTAFIKRKIDEGYKLTGGVLGHCHKRIEDVLVLDCVNCGGKTRKFRSIAAWELCVRQYILQEGRL